MLRVSAADFERYVNQALDDLPPWVQEHLDNVVVLAAGWPTAEQFAAGGVRAGHLLLGLYEGVPLTQRGRRYNLTPPDRITLFHRSLEMIASDEQDLVRLIRRTVLHEVAHHFGFSDDQLRQLQL